MFATNGPFGSRSVRRRGACVSVVLLLMAISPRAVWAQFSLSSETRSIDASASGSTMLNDATSGAGVYNNSIENDGMPDFTGDTESATGIGAQNTDIETSGFSGNGSATANTTLSGVIQDSFTASADSDFSVTFMVPVQTAIKLTGLLTATSVDATVGASFDTFSASTSPSTASVPISFNETLQPGKSYTLQFTDSCVSALSIDGQDFESSTDGGEGDYSFSFTATNVPEPTGGILLPAAFAILSRSRRRDRGQNA